MVNYVLFTIKNKKTGEWAYFAGLNEKEVKEGLGYIENKFLKEEFDIRTLKQVAFPKGRYKTTNLDGSIIYIFYDGELFVEWDDEAHRDYPEDLIWDRDISRLVGEVEQLKEKEFQDAKTQS